MNALGIILARASSAGLNGKHLLGLLGRPVITYTFDHARSSRHLTRVVVSSDCAQVRKLAEQSWFETIIRPPALATNEASVQDVLLHALDTMESRSSYRPDAVVVLYGNVPVRPRGIIDEALETLQKTGCDSVRSFTPVGKWHPSWMARLEGDRVTPLHDGSIDRRQDLEPLYLHDGAVVAVRRDVVVAARNAPHDPHAFFGVDRRGITTAMGSTVEIDHLRDLHWAEAVLREREREITTTVRMAA